MNRTSAIREEQQTSRQQQERQASEGASGCLLRVYWMLLGNALLAAAAYRVFQAKGALTVVDVLYWLAVTSLIGARYVDIRFLDGLTAEGQPATIRHWQRYSLGVLGASLLLWIAIHGLGWLVQ